MQAHDHAIKCLCMNEDETMFCTGSADGDIKVWDLSFHRIVHTYQGEHARHGLFKNISQGVAQVNIKPGLERYIENRIIIIIVVISQLNILLT